jgi:hypothetical protein
MNNRQRRRARNRKLKGFQKAERVQEERYRSGPVYVVGRRARYRTGRGIAKVGDPRGCNGPVRILVKNGVVAKDPSPADSSSMAPVFQFQEENTVETQEPPW